MDKPIVRYRGQAAFTLNDRAILVPVDHPNADGLLENGLPATTSRIVSHDPATGRIETQNTIYLPEEQTT